jgi:NTE family protein
MTTPDLGASMTDFSYTPQHLDQGRAAAETLIDQLGREPVRVAVPRRSTIRLWDRRPRVS